MIIYVEKRVQDLEITQSIFAKHLWAEVLFIDNYKNIFDKKIHYSTQKSIVLAAVDQAMSQAPPLYGHPWWAYFFKNSLNCVYDCKYCYLKWSFKHEQQVFFVNYDYIQKQILQTLQNSHHWMNRFYASDYSDNLATDSLTQFSAYFVPFFAELKWARMELRTKSSNVSELLKLKPNDNVEIAFSLNPSEVIDSYEYKTPKLEARIKAIISLQHAGWKVGIRFIPLLEIKNYETIYNNFLDYLLEQIDFSKISSVFIGWLLFTHNDYKQILKKEAYLDLLYKLEKNTDGYFRENRKVRDYFYKLFKTKLNNINCQLCLDK